MRILFQEMPFSKSNFSEKFNILVDGGLKSTYNHWIKPLIFYENMNELIFDLVIVTHIDCDHIGGIVAFLEDCEKTVEWD